MAAETENQTSNLLTNLKSLVKTYLVYDVNNRIIASYEAKTEAASGDPCVLTQYTYRTSGSGISSQIRFRKETNSNWDPDSQDWNSELQTLPSPVNDLDLP